MKPVVLRFGRLLLEPVIQRAKFRLNVPDGMVALAPPVEVRRVELHRPPEKCVMGSSFFFIFFPFFLCGPMIGPPIGPISGPMIGPIALIFLIITNSYESSVWPGVRVDHEAIFNAL